MIRRQLMNVLTLFENVSGGGFTSSNSRAQMLEEVLTAQSGISSKFDVIIKNTNVPATLLASAAVPSITYTCIAANIIVDHKERPIRLLKPTVLLYKEDRWKKTRGKLSLRSSTLKMSGFMFSGQEDSRVPVSCFRPQMA